MFVQAPVHRTARLSLARRPPVMCGPPAVEAPTTPAPSRYDPATIGLEIARLRFKYPGDAELTCCHEAGHLTVCLHFAVPVWSASMDGGQWGLCQHGHDTRREVLGYVAIAGVAAETILTGRHVELSGPDLDAATYHLGWDVDTARRRVESLLRQRWDAVQEFAVHLRWRQRLTHDEINAIGRRFHLQLSTEGTSGA